MAPSRGSITGVQSPPSVGDEGRGSMTIKGKVAPDTPLSCSATAAALQSSTANWNFWTDDAEQVQAILRRFKTATVFHGHPPAADEPHRQHPSTGAIDRRGRGPTRINGPAGDDGADGPPLIRSIGHDGCGERLGDGQRRGLIDKVFNLVESQTRDRAALPRSRRQRVARRTCPGALTLRSVMDENVEHPGRVLSLPVSFAASCWRRQAISPEKADRQADAPPRLLTT